MNPRPSRKGLRIRPHKGGRTVELPKGKVTPEELELILKVKGDLSFSDWCVNTAKLQNLARRMPGPVEWPEQIKSPAE